MQVLPISAPEQVLGSYLNSEILPTLRSLERTRSSFPITALLEIEAEYELIEKTTDAVASKILI